MGFSAKSNNTMGTVKTTAHRYLSQRHVCCLGGKQGRRKVSNIGEAPFKSIPKFPENIGGAQLLAAPNIGGARAPVPPPPVPTALGRTQCCQKQEL